MAKKRKKRSVAVIDLKTEGPTKERMKHAGTGGYIIDHIPVATCGGRTIKRVSFKDTCPLDKYLAKGKIDARQWKAGEEFAERWFRAFGSPFMVCDPSRDIRGAAGANKKDFRPDFYELAFKSGIACKNEHGIHWSGPGKIVVRVCGMETALAGGKQLEMLRNGLDAVADFLKLHSV